MRKILGVFEVFLGIFEKTKEKEDRDCPHIVEQCQVVVFIVDDFGF